MRFSLRKIFSGFTIYAVAITIAVGAMLIIIGSLFYSNHLVQNLAEQELRRVENYGDVLKYVAMADPACETSSIFNDFIRANQSIPTVLTDADLNVIDHRNITTDSTIAEQEVQDFLDRMVSKGAKRVEIDLGFGMKNYVYYDESTHLKQLRLFPYLQLLVIGIFILVIFVGFSVAKRNEQNKVWVGLAKETAHQLGTPVSSLMAWVELLKLKLGENPEDVELLLELQKDVDRLEMITERFSKIGSKPELKETDFPVVVERAADYIRKRMPRKVTLDVQNNMTTETPVMLNSPLFEWVIENLLKNALDAMGDEGALNISINENAQDFLVDVSDTGKGIAPHLHKRVFKPGFTTKKRGWGLGLSLVRRIIENYHDGKIFVKESTVGKGTTFRIILPKKS